MFLAPAWGQNENLLYSYDSDYGNSPLPDYTGSRYKDVILSLGFVMTHKE